MCVSVTEDKWERESGDEQVGLEEVGIDTDGGL